MQTEEMMEQGRDEYQDAFENDSYGITPSAPEAAPGPDGQDGGGEGAAAVIVVADGEGMGKAAEDAMARESAKASSDAASQEGASPGAPPTGAEEAGAAADDMAPSDDPAKERQRLKSWEGRLKKMAADLEAKAASTATPVSEVASEVIEDAGEAAEAEGSPGAAAAAEAVAEQVESGEITPEEAMRQLTEDFGEGFVNTLKVAFRAMLDETVGGRMNEMTEGVNSVISSINDVRQREHFEAIEDAHSDFQDVAADPALDDFIAQSPDPEAKAAIRKSGTARQVIRLISDFKAWRDAGGKPADKPAAEPPAGGIELPPAPAESGPDPESGEAYVDEEDLAAMEAVPTGGGISPSGSGGEAAKDDYAGAWGSF